MGGNCAASTGATIEIVPKSKSDDLRRIRVRIGMVVARVYRETLISGIWIARDAVPASWRIRGEFGNILQG